MGSITEKGSWPEDIYRIQKTDPVLGGEDGIINIQPEQVANRTRWLKDAFELEHTPDGKHRIGNDGIAGNAAIPEELLDLDVPTADLRKRLATSETAIEWLRAGVENLIGENGLLTEGLAKVAQLNWRYGLWGGEFEFFVDGLTMRDAANVDARAVIGQDDSIDCSNTRGFRPGMRLLVSDGEFREEVEIRSVLEKGRIRLVNDLSRTYSEPATLGYTDWDLSTPGMAVVKEGQLYFSRFSDVLENCGEGQLLILRNAGAGSLKVEYREVADNGPWDVAELLETFSGENGFVYERYHISAMNVQLKITGASPEPVTVRNMALLPTPFNFLPSSIRTPHVVNPESRADIWQDLFCLESSAFLAAYRDNHVQTEYGFFLEGESVPVKVVDLRAITLQVMEDLADMPDAGDYFIRCRHQSDVGEWSLWSDAVPVSLHPVRILFGFAGSAKSKGFGHAPLDRLGFYPVRFGFAGAKLSAGFDTAKIVFTTKLED